MQVKFNNKVIAKTTNPHVARAPQENRGDYSDFNEQDKAIILTVLKLYGKDNAVSAKKISRDLPKEVGIEGTGRVFNLLMGLEKDGKAVRWTRPQHLKSTRNKTLWSIK